MKLFRETYLVLRKDLVLQLRRRDTLLTMFFFGTLLLFVFHLSFDLVPERVSEMAPGLLWLAFLFTGTLGLAQLFGAERENQCLDALLLSPVDRGALFLAHFKHGTPGPRPGEFRGADSRGKIAAQGIPPCGQFATGRLELKCRFFARAHGTGERLLAGFLLPFTQGSDRLKRESKRFHRLVVLGCRTDGVG